MNNQSDLVGKQSEASKYVGIIATPDVWTWKGYKKFGRWQYPKQILSVLLTSAAVGLLVGAVATGIVTVLILNRIQ